jgi:hypothetical protein
MTLAMPAVTAALGVPLARLDAEGLAEEEERPPCEEDGLSGPS